MQSPCKTCPNKDRDKSKCLINGCTKPGDMVRKEHEPHWTHTGVEVYPEPQTIIGQSE